MDTRDAQINQLLDDVLIRRRRGEPVDLNSIYNAHPELAEELCQLLPCALVMEDVKPNSEIADGSHLQSAKLPAQIGNYRILCEIGRGGMGIVYEAEHETLGRRVALKLLPFQLVNQPRARERFQREARAAAQMHHSSIVPIFEVGAGDDQVYYTMQLIEGQSLDLMIEELVRLQEQMPAAHSDSDSTGHGIAGVSQDRDANQPRHDSGDIASRLLSGQFEIKRLRRSTSLSGRVGEARRSITRQSDGSLNHEASAENPPETSLVPPEQLGKAADLSAYWRRVARIGRQAADALAYAHSHGIIHRDVKPSNLILDVEGVAWITDFGLAKTAEMGLTQTGDFMGTLRYMPPEQIRGRCDERSDVYSLGVTLYELAVLKPAFPSPDRLILIDAIQNSDPPKPRSQNAQIPRDLETIILKASQKDPGARYQSAFALAEDLRRFLDDEVIRARRSSVPERILRWSRRNKSLATSVLITSLMTIMLILVMAMAAVHFRRQHAVQVGLLDGLQSEAARANQAEVNLRQNLYFAQMNLAGQLIDKPSGILRISELTDQWQPSKAGVDLRGWEWFYLRALCRSDELTLAESANLYMVHDVKWNPSGTRVALGQPDGQVTIWDAATGEELSAYDGHTGKVYSANWSPDGTKIASAGLNGAVHVWEAETGQTLRIFADLGQGEHVPQVIWNPAGDRIAWGNGRTVLIGDPAGIAPTITWQVDAIRVNRIQWSPDGTRLACGNWWLHKMEIWDVAAKEKVGDLTCRAVKWNSTGHELQYWLTSEPSGELQVWDAATGTPIERIIGHTAQVSSVAWNPEGNRLLTGSIDKTIRLWELPSGRHVRTFQGHTDEVAGVGWSPQETHIASWSRDGTAKIWPIASRTKTVLRGDSPFLRGVNWHPEKSQLATAHSDGSVRIWDAITGETRILSEAGGQAYRAIWDPSGNRIAAGGTDSIVRIWDGTDDEEPRLLRGHVGLVMDLDWHPDGRYLVSVSDDHKIQLWDTAAATDEPRQSILKHSGPVQAAHWNPQGTSLITASRDGMIFVWDGIPLELRLAFHAHNEAVNDLKWSPDGRQFASAGRDATIKLWDASTMTLLQALRGHSGPIWAMDWSPDGGRLASASRDGTIKLWDPMTGAEIFTLQDFSEGVISLDWSPDGQHISAGGVNGDAVIWDASQGYTESLPANPARP